MSASRTYRICLYDDQLRSLSAELIEAATDDEAVAQAQLAGQGAKAEVWHGTRLVARLGAGEFVPAPSGEWGLTAAE